MKKEKYTKKLVLKQNNKTHPTKATPLTNIKYFGEKKRQVFKEQKRRINNERIDFGYIH